VDGDSGLMSATVPLFNQAHVPDVSAAWGRAVRQEPLSPTSGGPRLATTWRVHARRHVKFATGFTGWRRSSVTRPGARRATCRASTAGARHLGLTIVANEAIALDQTTYENEVQKLIAAHPQVIVTESDSQTAGCCSGTRSRLTGTTDRRHLGTLGTDFDRRRSPALGKTAYESRFVRVISYAQQSGTAWRAEGRATRLRASW
jgi:hypothetical protein